jgi:hypothetical protein
MRATRNYLLPICLLLPCIGFQLAIGTAQATTHPDYELFDDLLLQNVRRGFVDYDGLNMDPRFPTFIKQIGMMDSKVMKSTADQLAFYINTYNALALRGILDGLSPSSRFGRIKFFDRTKFLVLGEETSLSTLEHERIIPIGDPRIHFAIVCASLSCPRLSSRAYLSADINNQLHEAARRFINDPTRNRFDLERRIAFISMIFEWYEEDFVTAGGSVQQYIARFVSDAQVQDALRLDEFELRYETYDWSLNGHFSGNDK